MSVFAVAAQQNSNAVLPTTAAAHFLGLRPQTLRKWRLLGTGPIFTRLGDGSRARVGYLLSDLQDWINARRFRSTSEETVAKAHSGVDTVGHRGGGAS